MIINGGSRSAGGWWSKHLGNTKDNERVTLTEVVGLDAATIPDLFHEMEILARSSGSKATNYFYQVNINPRDHEFLTPDQRHEAKELLLKNLGLSGQPHFVVEHEKEGRVHFHVLALRIDMERGRAIPDSLTAAIHERTSRQLEVMFDLERGKSILTPDRAFERPERDPKKFEIFRGNETGIYPQTVATDARQARAHADNGHSFKAALEASGHYVLAAGDRRDFVIIDLAGDDHSLGRRLGMKAKDLRVYMADLDPASLPSVEQAKEIQRDRQHQLETDRAAGQAMPAAHAAAKGRTDEIGRVFGATARTPEPVAPLWDRDAATRAADEQIIDAAIQADQAARAAARGRKDDLRSGPRETRQTAAAAPQAERPGHEAEPVYSPPPSPLREGSAPASGLRDADNIVTRIFGGLSRAAEKFVDFLGDMIAPAPPPTPDQAQRMANTAAEQAVEQEAREAAARREAAHDFLLREIERSRQSTDQTPTAAERFGTPGRSTERDDGGRGYERER